VLGRLKKHLLEVKAIRLLDVGALGDRHMGGAQAVRQLVADTLELSQVKQSRIGRSFGRALAKASHRIGGDEGIAKVTLEPRYLGPQRTPCCQLIANRVRFANRGDELRLPDLLV
jgi:hypothetical protein